MAGQARDTETLSANGNSYRPVSGDGKVKTTIFYYSVGAAAARKIDAKATYLLQITIHLPPHLLVS